MEKTQNPKSKIQIKVNGKNSFDYESLNNFLQENENKVKGWKDSELTSIEQCSTGKIKNIK
jgi:hypothetical protein